MNGLGIAVAKAESVFDFGNMSAGNKNGIYVLDAGKASLRSMKIQVYVMVEVSNKASIMFECVYCCCVLQWVQCSDEV